MSQEKPTCGTCPHWHPYEPKLGEPVLLSVTPVGECRGAPAQGRIVKGNWMTLYTPTMQDTPACKEHPNYVPARECPPRPYPLAGDGIIHYDVGRTEAPCGAYLGDDNGPARTTFLHAVNCQECKALGERL